MRLPTIPSVTVRNPVVNASIFALPHIIVDQDHIPEISLVFFKGMSFGALELREGLLARLPPQQGEGSEVIGTVGTDGNSHQTHTAQ